MQEYNENPGLTAKLITGEIGIDSLNPAKQSDQKAFLSAVEQRPNLLSKLKGNNAQKFIKIAITEKPEYFVYLSLDQYTEELAQLFLFTRLKTDRINRQKKGEKQNQKCDEIAVQRSADNKIVFCFSHATTDDEEIYYFDPDLQIPTSLKSKFKVSLKLDNAIAFIDKADSLITQLGENKIKSIVSDIIVSEYRSYLNGFLSRENIGFYKLCAAISDLETGFADRLTKRFADYGISVRQVSIEKISIPDDIRHKIEDQAILIRQQRVVSDAENEIAKKSLENYEAKLAIEQKYPDSEHSLTEYEKDLALKRYLSKIGQIESETVDHSIKIASDAIPNDGEIQKKKDVVPEVPRKKNTFLTAFVGLAIFFFVCSAIIFFAANKGAGLIVLGVITFIFGFVAAFNYKKFKTEAPKQPDNNQTDSAERSAAVPSEPTDKISDKGGSEQ